MLNTFGFNQTSKSVENLNTTQLMKFKTAKQEVSRALILPLTM